MEVEGWRYYNHVLIPDSAPHIMANTGPLDDGRTWQMEKSFPVAAIWSSEWDCGYETEWWYVIKDDPFDVESIKSKRRYEIKKGDSNFEVRMIDPADYIEDLLKVTKEAYKGWPEKYRPSVRDAAFMENIIQMKTYDVFAAFSRKNGSLCGYAQVKDKNSCAEFAVLRADPEEERLGINAAIVNGILGHYKERLRGDFYIYDGSRSVRHETAFQDYLEKYFGFRKAYCRLNIRYRKGFSALINILYPFRNMIGGYTGIGSGIRGLLTLEEIKRSCMEDSADE